MDKQIVIQELKDKLGKLKLALDECQNIVDEQVNKEQAIKLVMNSIYGAMGNTHQTFFNPDIAEAITIQGKEIILFAEQILNHYFMNLWHTDVKLHERMGIEKVNRSVSNVCVKYSDTDSGSEFSIINTNIGKLDFVSVFERLKQEYQVQNDFKGNEIIYPNDLTVKNFVNNEVLNTRVKLILRHKVNKPKWIIKSKSGKEVIVTNDHSIIVFRDGKQMSIKACEINIKTDKVLTIL